MKQPDLAKMERLVRELLVELGEDPAREGLVKTPERVARALAFLTHGYRTRLDEVINQALFTQATSSMVIVKDIELYSLCEHHMLPFFGRCHIGYIPDGKVFGVSKLARLVDMFARRLQLQERLTEEISKVVMEEVGARGVGVMIRGAAPVYVDAGGREAELDHGDVVGARRLPRASRDARRVPYTGEKNMNDAITGALVGLGIAVFLFIFDYMMIKKSAAERAKRNHQTVVVLDSTEKKRISSLMRFCLVLPPAFAFAFWVLAKV
jgi:GTP cyclohydrolase I